MTTYERSWQSLVGDPAPPPKRRLTRGALTVASWLYGLGVAGHRFAYRSGIVSPACLSVPVLSVGNLVVGGVGKTPTVRWLAERLQQWGRKPAIISRGCGGAAEDSGCRVSDGREISLPAEVTGDEPLMLARALPGVPVFAGKRRAPLARQAIEECGCDVILLDDGHQHWKIAADWRLLLLDHAAPFGNGRLLPAGPLRETPSAARRADALLITDGEPTCSRLTQPVRNRLLRLKPGIPLAHVHYRPNGWRDLRSGKRLPTDHLAGRRVSVLTGIAHPERFVATAKGLGVAIGAVYEYPDHQPLIGPLAASVAGEAPEKEVTAVIVTDKDAVKLDLDQLPRSATPPFYALEVEWEWLEGREALERSLRNCLETTAAA